MTFNRWDIVAAYKLFFTHYYDGQWSEKYRRLCKIESYTHNFPETEQELQRFSLNAYDIYVELCNAEERLLARSKRRWVK